MGQTFHRFLKEVGIERLGVHALRHTFATRAIKSGMDVRTLSEILGYTNITLTLQLYAHSTSQTKRTAMKQMEVFSTPICIFRFPYGVFGLSSKAIPYICSVACQPSHGGMNTESIVFSRLQMIKL